MSITVNNLIRMARVKHTLGALRSVVFDGKSAMVVSEMTWIVGVPCAQPNITEPVVVPVDAIQTHLAKSRHLVVMPDHLSNGQGLVTPFNKPPKWDDSVVLGLLPKQPKGKAVCFDLELDAVDRVLIAAGEHDVRYYLNGVLFDLTDGALVGTSGHCLHAYDNRVPKLFKPQLVAGCVSRTKNVRLIVPRAPLALLVHSASKAATVNIWNANAKFNESNSYVTDAKPVLLLQTDDAFVYVNKPIEGNFPDYLRVKPAVSRRPVWMEICPVQLSATVEAMGKVLHLQNSKKFDGLVVDFGHGEVLADPTEDGRAFKCVLHTDGADDLEALKRDYWAGFNFNYLRDLADCVTDKAQWRADATNPAGQCLLVTEGDFWGIVMPTRIGGPDKPKKVAETEPVAALVAETGPVAALVAETGPVAALVAETGPVGPESPENAPESPPVEPCPAAVAALVSQLVENAQESAKKEPKKAKIRAVKAVKTVQAEPVAA